MEFPFESVLIMKNYSSVNISSENDSYDWEEANHSACILKHA